MSLRRFSRASRDSPMPPSRSLGVSQLWRCSQTSSPVSGRKELGGPREGCLMPQYEQSEQTQPQASQGEAGDDIGPPVNAQVDPRQTDEPDEHDGSRPYPELDADGSTRAE